MEKYRIAQDVLVAEMDAVIAQERQVMRCMDRAKESRRGIQSGSLITERTIAMMRNCLLKREGGDVLIDYALPWFEYRGFVSQPHYSEEDGVWYGKIDNISDLVLNESDDISKLYTEFVKAVEDYVDFCREVSRHKHAFL